MNFSKKNHEHKKGNIFFVSKNYDHFFPRTTTTVLTFFMFLSAILFNSCEKPVDRSNDISQKDIELMKENHIIPLKEAVSMFKKYDKDRVKILKDTLEKKYKDSKFNDTRMVWLDIKTMKAYIKHIEDESGKIGINPDGLQFYFGVNLDKEASKKKNHQTFFVAPTMKNLMNGDSIHSGFTIENGERIFLYEAFKKYNESMSRNVKKANFFSLVQSEDGLLLNRNGDTPPGNNN